MNDYDKKYLRDRSLYAGPLGLDILFASPRPRGLGYEILALQAIYEAVLAVSINLNDTMYRNAMDQKRSRGSY